MDCYRMTWKTWATATNGQAWLGCLLALGAMAGCSSEPAEFQMNLVAVHRAEISSGAKFDREHQLRPIAEITTALFGTPDDPYLPDVPGMREVLDLDKVRMSAGPYGRDDQGRVRGLYRQHCVHCHGISGDGAGPTALYLNPYPRDYRPGKYKFKSTPTGTPPTHADLTKVIMEGVPGTAMPSFKLLDPDEVESLVHYVRYLTIRGEVERSMIMEFAELDTSVVKPSSQLSASEREFVSGLSAEDKKAEIETLKSDLAELQSASVIVEDFLGPILQKWSEAEGRVTEIAARSVVDEQESIEAGRRLFFSTKSGCSGCHGESAIGDGQSNDLFYDDWVEEYYDPQNPEHLEDFLALGALPPRKLKPRNLREGVFRGGRRQIDVYWRIRNGIDGAKMPAANQLSEEEVWNLVDFVRRGLPYDGISRPQQPTQENVRVRN